MSTVFSFPDGASFQFSSTFGALRTVTAITNASPPVVTAAAHGFATNDIVLLESGWENMSETLYRVTQLTADTFSLPGENTVAPSQMFPAGAGAGTARSVTNWRNIPNVISISGQGGEPRNKEQQFLARQSPIILRNGTTARSYTLNVAYAPGNTIYQELLALSRINGLCAFRYLLAGGVQVLGYGHVFVPEGPQLATGEINQVALRFDFRGRETSYT